MKKILILAFLPIAIHAGTQTFELTGGNLAGWTVVAAEVNTLAVDGPPILPAGAQLARTFATADIAVSLSSFLTLGTKAEDWPVVEIGSAALMFMRDGGEARLVLSLGTDDTHVLPMVTALDASGRTVEPWTVEFHHDGASIQVSASGQTLRFPVQSPAGAGCEVVLSAGAGNPWSFERLQIAVTTADVAQQAVDQRGVDIDSRSRAATDPGNPSQTTRSGAAGLEGITRGNAPTAADAGTAIAPANLSGATVGSLELFTPPAVRRGRADDLPRQAGAGPAQR